MELSVVIIARPKEEHLEKVLKSVAWVEEKIVVVDSQNEIECETVRQCQEIGAKTFFRKLDDFASQKNFAIAKAKNQWVLSLDSDEIVTDDLRREIEEVLSSPKFWGYWVSRKNLIGGKWLKHGELFPDYSLRLFRKDKGKFVGKIHERVVLEGETTKFKEPLIHYTYKDLKDYYEKVKKYSEKEALMEFESGARASLFSFLKIPFRFFKLYCLKLGFLDGVYGLASAYLLTYYSWSKLAKIKSLEKAR